MFGLFSSTPATPVTTHLTNALKGDQQAWTQLIAHIEKGTVSNADKDLLKKQQTAPAIPGEMPGARETLLGFCFKRNLWRENSSLEQEKKVRESFTKGAENQFPEGLYQAAILCIRENDYQTAEKHLLAVNNKVYHLRASFALADLYNSNNIGKPNLDKAAHWYQQVYQHEQANMMPALQTNMQLISDAKVAYAKIRLAQATTVEQEASPVETLRFESESNGNKDAAYALGQYHLKKNNYQQAIRSFELAGKFNHAAANIALADMLITGKGCQVDLKRAVILLRKYGSKSVYGELGTQRAACISSDDPEIRYHYAIAIEPFSLPDLVKQPLGVLVSYLCKDDILTFKEKFQNITKLPLFTNLSNLDAMAKEASALCTFARSLADAINAQNNKKGDEFSTHVTSIDDITDQQCLKLLDLVPKNVANYDECCRVFASIAYDFASFTRASKAPTLIPLIHAFPSLALSGGPTCRSFLQSGTDKFPATEKFADSSQQQSFTTIANQLFNVDRLPLLVTEMSDLIATDITIMTKIMDVELQKLSFAESAIAWPFIKILKSNLNDIISTINAALPDPNPKRRATPQQQIEKFDGMLISLLKIKESLQGKTSDFNEVIPHLHKTGTLFSNHLKQLHPELAPPQQAQAPASALTPPRMG
jgi:hypothetical protein